MELRAKYAPEHLGTYVVRLFDAENILSPLLSQVNQQGLIEKWAFSSLREFAEHNILFIDPALEYLRYEPHLNKFAGLRIPKVFASYVKICQQKNEEMDSSEYRKWKEARHKLFWKKLDEDPKQEEIMLGEIRDLELYYKADVLLPPVPLVTSEKLFDISKKINRIFRGISKSRPAECANYFVFPQNVLQDDSMIDEVLEYIREDDSSNLTALKFKYFDVEKRGALSERENYGNLSKELAIIKEQHPNKVFMLLEGSHHVYPSAVVGFDIVSTSTTGLDLDGGFGTYPYGHWYDPEKMVQRPYEEVKKLFNNNGHYMPCRCEACKKITNIDSIALDEWNYFRRQHYILTMNNYMEEIQRAIIERNIELARDKLVNSDLSNLKDLIPRY
jgi:hypothetical protein